MESVHSFSSKRDSLADSIACGMLHTYSSSKTHDLWKTPSMHMYVVSAQAWIPGRGAGTTSSIGHRTAQYCVPDPVLLSIRPYWSLHTSEPLFETPIRHPSPTPTFTIIEPGDLVSLGEGKAA